jgi:uncharacterized membrane protein
MVQQTQDGTTADTGTRPSIGFTAAQIALSCVGGVDAVLLWLKHRGSVDLPCTADGGCETIANSAYAHMVLLGHDIPIALVGLAGYMLLLTLAGAKLVSETRAGVRALCLALLLVSGCGTAYSWYLQYIAHFVIKAFCPYCFVSACVMTALFAVGAFELRALRRL